MSLNPGWFSHRIILDKVHGLLLTLSYCWPDRFEQLLSLTTLICLFLYLLVSTYLVFTGIVARFRIKKENLERATVRNGHIYSPRLKL